LASAAISIQKPMSISAVVELTEKEARLIPLAVVMAITMATEAKQTGSVATVSTVKDMVDMLRLWEKFFGEFSANDREGLRKKMEALTMGALIAAEARSEIQRIRKNENLS
jgi:hypothetical protein